MKSYSIAIAFAALAVAALAPSPARGQALSAPIVVRTPGNENADAKAHGNKWLKAEVIHADGESIIVREKADERMIHTFTFAPNVKTKMQAIVNKGGYQYGDKVKILHRPGQTVALKISGKPSL